MPNHLRDDQGGPRTVAADLSAAGRDRARDIGDRPSTGALRLLGSLGGAVVANVPPRLRIEDLTPEAPRSNVHGVGVLSVDRLSS
jgi:hypothetical protein